MTPRRAQALLPANGKLFEGHESKGWTEWKSFKESDFALENSAVIQFS
jgi:hypothetical protein